MSTLLAAASIIPFFPDPYHPEKYGGSARSVCFWEWIVKEFNEVYTGVELNVTKEDFREHWGYLDYSGKTVLDVGADVGSTALYFLNMGALHVYAVEGDDKYFTQLLKNSAAFGETTPIRCQIESSDDFFSLITKFHPDIMKADIEGSEIHLLSVPDWVLQIVPEYILETHSDETFALLSSKLQQAGYTVAYVVYDKDLKLIIAQL